MTVKELIEKLKTFPEDAYVVYRLYSDISGMNDEEIKFFTAADRQVVKRNGDFMTYEKWFWPAEKEEKPVYVDAVLFPGN